MQTYAQQRRIKRHIEKLFSKHDIEKRSSCEDMFGSREDMSGMALPPANPNLAGTARRNLASEHGKNKSDETTTMGDPFLVTFDGDSDPEHPQNWKMSYKSVVTAVIGINGFVVGWASSIDSAALRQAKKEFGVSTVVEAFAGTGIYLIAFGVGSLVSGPFSESVGRNPVYLISLLLFMIFIMASALAPNIGAQTTFRFLAGFFGCTPLTTFGGSVADMWSPLHRTIVFPVCACLSFLGPFLAPMVGAFIGQSNAISWRWTEWTTLIMAGMLFTAIFFVVPETYAPIILEWKAQQLRRVTGQDGYLAEIELRREGLATRLLRSMYRPFIMLSKEIMVMLFSLYLSVVYIVLFTFLTGYDFIYGDIYRFSQGNQGLTWIAVNVGFLFALAMAPFIYAQFKTKFLAAQAQGKKVEPEQRLWYAMIGAPWFPVSLFWLAWTSRESISFWCSLVATMVFGFSAMCIFIPCYQYLIDAYEGYVASALVGLTFSRYVVSGAMVVVSVPMYENLGVDWTLTLLGCIAVLLTPIPYVFYMYGGKVRARSPSARAD